MSVNDNIKSLRAEIRALAETAGRKPDSVHLMAVSKMQPEEKISEALEAGQRLFGENRVQEAIKHWTPLKPRWPDVRLHLIGPLQTNKVKEAVRLFDCIETVDRGKLAIALAEEMKKQERYLPCMIEVNTGAEAQKAGVSPDDLPALLQCCRDNNLNITGLMCIPPHNEPAALHFALLKKLADRHKLPDLSMGMSADYQKAIPLGATYIRIGTALFGERDTADQ